MSSATNSMPWAEHYRKPAQGLRLSPINVALFWVGMVLTLSAWTSLLPVLAAALFYFAVYILLCLPKLGGFYERKIFTRVFAVGFLMSGVAAIYANYFQDPGQLTSDAAGFFDMASGQAKGVSLVELQLAHEGALAIVLWGVVYDFFADLGFPRERYIGTLVNVTAVALSGVVALKMARQVYGYDPARFQRLIILFSTCGLFWLFSSIHIRDSVVLLAVTALTYTWIYFLAKPDLGRRLLTVVAISLLAAAFFGFLRAEFLFVPIAMAMAGVAALMTGHNKSRNRLVLYVLAFIGLGVVAVLAVNFGKEVQQALLLGNEGYTQHAANQHDNDSMGFNLIVNQPMPVRVVLGSAYLFVFPIPFWVGLQFDSAYELFKSLNVIFFYCLVPLLVLAVRKLWILKAERSPAILFVLLLSLGFTLAVAATSLETRHLGAFLVPIFILGLLPDLNLTTARKNYRAFLVLMFGGVALLHIAWAITKL